MTSCPCAAPCVMPSAEVPDHIWLLNNAYWHECAIPESYWNMGMCDRNGTSVIYGLITRDLTQSTFHNGRGLAISIPIFDLSFGTDCRFSDTSASITHFRSAQRPFVAFECLVPPSVSRYDHRRQCPLTHPFLLYRHNYGQRSAEEALLTGEGPILDD